MADELQHIYIKDDSMGFEQATEATLEQAGFVRASRLAAAKAMVSKAIRAIDDGAGVQSVRRILASRPSEQASGPAICGGCDTHVHDCQPLWKQQKKCCPDCSHQPDPELSRISELETQLAEAKADLSAIHDELEQWGFLKPSGDVMSVKQLINAYCGLDAKLEAAEAERAHLSEAAELVRQALRDGHGSHDNWTKLKTWYDRDQSRAAAATEQPKHDHVACHKCGKPAQVNDGDDSLGPPVCCDCYDADWKPQAALCIHCLKPVHEGRCGLPNPQGARLGGPADKLRADIVEAAREAGGMTGQQWQTFAELLGKNP